MAAQQHHILSPIAADLEDQLVHPNLDNHPVQKVQRNLKFREVEINHFFKFLISR